MLYRTHHHHHNPFLFTFKPFPHSSPSSLSPHLLLSSISPPLQEMEFLQGAFGPVAAVKTTASVDNFCVSGDDLFVDELLDFSTALSETEEQEEKEQDQNKTPSVYVSEEKQLTKPENSVLSSKDDYGSLTDSELSVPVEGLESLEWLSHFVEDSFSDYPLTGILPPNPEEFRSEPKKLSHNPVTKARTKRARSGLRVWPVLSPSFSEPSTSSTSSTSSTTPPNFWAVQMQAGESLLSKPVFKKQKKKASAAESAAGGFLATQPRRCSHCGVTKTPQWRAGPLGSKTLCNACGVRFKSGRLVPEYRPACSPTFSSELHSNNHRKVMEMRRQKEMEFAAADPVQSF